MTFRTALALLSAACCWSACFKSKPIDVPAYIYIGAVDFQIQDSLLQGSASHNIPDVWISVDGQLIGAKTLPVKLPAFYNDSLDMNMIRIAPGIYENGAGNVRQIYPFYRRHEEQRKLEPGKVDTFYPVFRYEPTANIILVDDFEGAGTNFGYDLDGIDTTTFIQSQEDVFEGNWSGKLVFDSVNRVAQVATSMQYSNLQNSSTTFPVYIELNCKTDVPLDVGLVGFVGNVQTEVQYFVGVNPGSGWKKLYFNCTTRLFQMQAQKYGLAFRAVRTDANPNPKVYIDNVKILHY